MAKIKLTPSQIEDKRARDQLLYITNKVKGSWSFGKLKTFKDLLQEYGAPTTPYFESELNHVLTFQDVKDYLSDRRIELETSIWLKYNPPDMTKEEYECATHPTILQAIKPPEEKFSVAEELSAKEWADKLPPVKRSKAFLFWFQKKAACQCIDAYKRGDRAAFLVAAPGAGKTFIAGYFLAWLVENNCAEGKTFSPWPRIYVTKASVVEQTRRVFEKFFGIKEDTCLVIGIDQMRSQFGKRFVKEEIVIQQGEEHYKWTWIKNLAPVEIFWDEAHALKNVTSKQSKIGQAYNDIEWGNIQTFQLFISASPGSKVCEFKCFCVATRVPYTFGIAKDAPLTNAHWTDFAQNIASDYGRLEDVCPEDRSPGAINRLMDYMDRYIIRVKGVRWQFNAINKIRMIDFETEKGRQEYNEAWEKFLEEKAKIEGNESMTNAESTFNILAQLTIFLKAAESNIDRVNLLARESYHNVQEGYAAVVAVRNKITICKTVALLIEEYGVSRDQISLIWGGAPVATKKQKLKKNLLGNAEVMKVFESEGISLADIDLDEIDVVPDNAYPKHYRFGNQSRIERQKEIDRFQQGKTLYCFYTYRAGGVGLSLHHTDEWMTRWNENAAGYDEWIKEIEEWNAKHPNNKAIPGKVRRKEESGYAFEQDIPYVLTRQRVVRMPPCWSPIDAVQGTNRVPRLTSLSNTHQEMIYFKGTVEERQAHVMSVALYCLTKVVRNKEKWEDLIIGRKGMSDAELENQLVKASTIDKIQNENYHDEDINEEDEEEEE